MSGRRNLAAAHAGYMTWDPPEVRCRGCECHFDSWQAFGDHVDGLLSAPPRSRAQAVRDVLADHLSDFGSDGTLEPCINGHGRIVCGCGWMAKGPDVEDWYDHLATAIQTGLDSVAAEAIGGHATDSEPGEWGDGYGG
ncbi:hypothetical protein [Bifidobacterium moukalabense]|uniref:hypothetical protein n=1 Tax=Bifidobacterium moukalabense TaxID=1333651 RepID=UPI0010FA22E6|nr:hypothetical protein [Bifidobacterium moukalabense]